MSSEEEPQSISSLITEYLDQPPSCLEFCPQDLDYFVAGTYLLHEGKPAENQSSSTVVKQTKTGSLQLWHLDAGTPKLQQKQLMPLPHAVFDLHFHPRQPNLLGVAGSDGTVSLYNVSSSISGQDEEKEETYAMEPHIQHIWTRPVHDDEDAAIPALYLTWFPQSWFPISVSTMTVPSYPDGFAVTFSDGRTSIFSTPQPASPQRGEVEVKEYEMTKNNGLELIETQFKSRECIETWFVALVSYREADSKKKTSFIFTGDDFGSLNTRNFSAPEKEENDDDDDDDDDDQIDLQSCMISNINDRARHHTAGVTAILPLPIAHLVENAPILLTGSYDEYIRVYHANSKGGKILAETRLGGGVWRLQVIHTETVRGKLFEEPAAETGLKISFLILASCMHAGTRIVKVTWKREALPSTGEVGDWDIHILAQFTEHESMNYASGVWKGDSKSGSDLVCVSSSFYDKRLCLWNVQI